MSKPFSLHPSNLKSLSWSILLFNCFGLKLFIDIGNYNILSPLFFYHFMGTLIITLAVSFPRPSRQTCALSVLHAGMALPSFGLILIHGTMTMAQLVLYFTFLFSTILTIQLILSAHQVRPAHQLFYSSITLFFLWGTNIVIESIDPIYNAIAPLTISYHFTLVTDGILHISTALYMLFLPFVWAGITIVKQT